MATPTNLPASFTTGQVLTSAETNALRGAFRILQVFSVATSAQVTVNTTTFTDIGLSVTITPQATTNKILLINATSMRSLTNGADVGIRFLRGATNIFESVQGFLLANEGMSVSSIFLDSPNTTSATTYKVQGQRNFGTGDTRFQVNSSCTSTLIVCEISA